VPHPAELFRRQSAWRLSTFIRFSAFRVVHINTVDIFLAFLDPPSHQADKHGHLTDTLHLFILIERYCFVRGIRNTPVCKVLVSFAVASHFYLKNYQLGIFFKF